MIDDPISSLDAFRCSCTEYEIFGLSERAAQVIVLSHDASFLHGIYDLADKATIKCLQFRPASGTSDIVEWDAELATQTRHSQDYFMLHRFLEGDADADPVSVARRIRPYLEGVFRVRYPDQFAAKEWLGDFIKKVREAKPGDQLGPLKKDLADLEKANQYTKGFHHGGMESFTVNDDELKAHIRIALGLASGGPSISLGTNIA